MYSIYRLKICLIFNLYLVQGWNSLSLFYFIIQIKILVISSKKIFLKLKINIHTDNITLVMKSKKIKKSCLKDV